MNWKAGSSSIAVVFITLNEQENIKKALENLKGWANEVFIVDSFSSDRTIDIAKEYGVYILKNKFKGFGDQWNFALKNLPITSPWTMKLDPDENLTEKLKKNLISSVEINEADAFIVQRRLWFMGVPLSVRQKLIRVWRTGTASFSNVLVNEHPITEGKIVEVKGDIEHFDSHNLEVWFNKQNKYTSMEAISKSLNLPLSTNLKLFGNTLERRMWFKFHYHRLPLRHMFLFFYFWLYLGGFRSGRVGYIWSRLRVDVMRFIEYKKFEIDNSAKIKKSYLNKDNKTPNKN